jgi:hypothetical protein
MNKASSIVPSLSIRRQSLFTKKRLQFFLVSGIILAGAIVLYRFDPVTSNIYPSSPFKALTGLFCPGCGTLRGLHQLLQGNFWSALDYNPLMVLSLPFLIYSYLGYATKILIGRSLPTPFLPSKWIWLLLKVIVAFWILRNIPVAPFSWLAP